MTYSDRKVHVANMGPTWVLSAPGGPHIGPMNLAIGLVMQNARVSIPYSYQDIPNPVCSTKNKSGACFVFSFD